MIVSKILLATMVLALMGCASAPSSSPGNAQFATASLTLFHPSQLRAQAARDESLCAPQFGPPANVVFASAPLAFGVPINVTALPWRWYHWDWQRHRLEAIAS
jgi:hypothetical protein